MTSHELELTARNLVAPGQGLLAADESSGTMNKRLEKAGIEASDEHRRAYRELLFTTAGLGEYISGAILYDETIRQSTEDGRPLRTVLQDQDIMPGIKVDTGAKPLAGFPEEKVTEGLDGLRDRLNEYADMGARFTKWRAVIGIGEDMPTDTCLDSNAHALARYAALAQEAGLVPVVEPEVLMEGDHSIERCAEVSEETLRRVYDQLADHRVQLEGTLLKPNMVVPGKEAPRQASPEEVVEATLTVCRRTVPAAVPGIVFLSGGQSPQDSTEHLNLMNTTGGEYPWVISFSYARALQGPALETWKGDPANWAAAQKKLAHRARMNSAAATGSYTPDMEKAETAS